MPDAPNRTKLAETVEIQRDGGKYTLLIDGEPFPWYIAENGIDVRPDIGLSVVTVQILVEREVAIHDTPIGPPMSYDDYAACDPCRTGKVDGTQCHRGGIGCPLPHADDPKQTSGSTTTPSAPSTRTTGPRRP